MKMMIAVPCMSTIPTKFLSCMLDLRTVCPTRYVNTENTLIYDARNDLALNAMAGGYDRIMWIDSDMKFKPDLIERLSKHLDDGADLACGLFFTRKIPPDPCIYRSLTGCTTPDGVAYIQADKYTDYPTNTTFPIAACGFGAVMTSVDLIKKVYDKFGLPFFPLPSIGEDLAFCWRAGQVGAKMVCDSSVKVGHVGYTEFNEDLYLMMQGKDKQNTAGPEQAERDRQQNMDGQQKNEERQSGADNP